MLMDLRSTLSNAGGTLSVSRCTDVVRDALGGEAEITSSHAAIMDRTLKRAREDERLATAYSSRKNQKPRSGCPICGKTTHRAARCPNRPHQNERGGRGGRGRGGRGGGPPPAAGAAAIAG